MTDAEQLLLSRCQSREYVRSRETFWSTVLGRPATEVIEEFLRNGLIKEADLPSALDFKFTAKELEAMLRARGLKVSGTKIVKISRLIDAAPVEIAEQVENVDLLLCTEQGKAIVDDFLRRQAEERSRAERDSLAALEAGNFRLATKIVKQFHAKQVFGGGTGPESRDSEDISMVRTLELIATATPRIIANAKPEAFPHLRRAAQIAELWGEQLAETCLPERLETGLRLDGITAARMISFYVYKNSHFSGMRDPDLAPFVKGFRVTTVGDGCPTCARLEGKIFSLDEAPELPYEHCTSERGCRCSLITLVIGDDS